jgi:hypothetical protein
MAIDAEPFGLAESDNELTFGVGVALKPWLPQLPRPLPPGEYDAETTALQRLYYLWSREPLWRQLAEYIGGIYAAPVAQQAQLDAARQLANATGQTLDEIGYGLGLGRMGLTDDEYRTAIPVRGASIDSDGTIGEILDIAIGLFGPDGVEYVPWYPRGFALLTPPLTAAEASLLAFLLAEPIPAGVGLTLVVTDTALAPGWSFSSGGSVDTWSSPRWDYSAGSDISATGPWGFAIAV